MENQIKKSEKEIFKALTRVIATAIAVVVLVIVQVATQYDDEKRMLAIGFFTSAVNVVVVLATIYIAVEFFAIAQRVKNFSAEVKLNSIPVIGISMLLLATCFFLQSIFEIRAVIKKGLSLLKIANSMEMDSGIATFFGDKNALLAIGAVLCLLTAVSFFLDGFAMITKSRKAPFWLRIVPPIWAGVTLLNVMMSYPAVVSAQSDISKVFSCVLTVLFLFYTSAQLCEVRISKKHFSSVFVRLSYPSLMFLTVAPYGFSMLFFTKNETVNIPHIAYVGLIIFSSMSAIQLIIMSLYEMAKKARHPKNDLAAQSAQKYSSDDVGVEWSYFDE